MLLDANVAIENVYRSDWGRIVAALIRLFGDFDFAEEVAQEAFAAAVDQWRSSGIPENPRAWLIQTARHKAIDRIRRKTSFAEKLESYAILEASQKVEGPGINAIDIPDDRLRLIFTCCHPALAFEAQVALTFRTLSARIRALTKPDILLFPEIRIVPVEISCRLQKRCRSWNIILAESAGRSRCRPQSRRFIARLREPKIRIGRRSSASIIFSSAP